MQKDNDGQHGGSGDDDGDSGDLLFIFYLTAEYVCCCCCGFVCTQLPKTSLKIERKRRNK